MFTYLSYFYNNEKYCFSLSINQSYPYAVDLNYSEPLLSTFTICVNNVSLYLMQSRLTPNIMNIGRTKSLV